MFWQLYQLLVVFSAGACAVLWMHRPVKPVFGIVGAAGWMIVALQARSITAYPGGTEVAVGSVPFQLFATAMGLFALVTVLFWHLGIYPAAVDEESGRAEVPSINGAD